MGGKQVYADNVAMTETTKFLAPETVNMLIQRVNAGGAAGFQVGDTISYIIQYKPVPNGGNTGANGYVTDYIPNGLQVIGASFVEPDGFGGFFEVPPVPAGDMSNDPGGNGTRFFVSPTPLLPATPLNTVNLGTLAQIYSDVGVWYSTDPRTAFLPAAAPAASRNNWDIAELAVCNAFKGANSPWGTCSPVSGPETFYQNELQLNPLLPPTPVGVYNVGPWHRIAVPGSRIGAYGLMGDLQASRELFPGDPQYGRDVLANPLPVASALTPVTVRWANGLNSVGQIKYVKLTARIASLPPGGTIINNSEVWGGDVFYGEGGKDNAWKYNNTLVSIGNNSDLTVIKTPSVQSAQAGDVVSFQVTVINTGAGVQTGVKVTDYLNASTEAKPGKPYQTMVSYNCDASGAPLYGGASGINGDIITPSPCPAVGGTLLPGNQAQAILAGGVEALQWTIPSLPPGAVYTYTYSVTALVPPNPKVTSASDQVAVTSTQLLPPGALAAASFEIGTFPLLAQSKTVTPSSVLPGGTVRYHIQVTNSGSGYAGVYRWGIPPINAAYPLDVLGIPIPTTVVDTLPSGFSYAGNPSLTINGAPILGSTVSALGNQVTWTIPHTLLFPNEIPPGAILDLYFDVAVAAGVSPGVYTNTAYTTIPYNKKPKNKVPKNKDWGTKPLYSINVAPVTVGAVQMAKVATPATVTNTPTGTATTYTITVTNNGAIAVNSVVVNDVLPAGFTYQQGSTAGSAGVGAPTVVGQKVTWPAFSVPANSSRTIVFNANVGATVLPAAYYTDVTATAANAVIPDLLQTAQVVVSAPGITVSKTVDKPVISWLGDGALVPVSDTVNYTITLKNSGNGYATVDVSDTLPAGFFFPQLGTESITMTVNGVPQVLTRGVANTTTTYNKWPGSVPALPLPLVGTRTPSWGTFTIPPKQGGLDSALTITFAARVDMQSVPAIGVTTVTQPGVYNNSVTIAGNAIVPIFTGAPVSIVSPVKKWTNTPSVAINGIIDYRLEIMNHDAYTWSGVSVVDYLGALTTAGIAPPVPSGVTFGVGNTAFYAIGAAAPAGAPGVDPLWLATVPTNVAPTLAFDNGGLGFSIPAGQSLFIAYTATAPAAVPVPAVVHNSIQSLTYTSNLIAKTITNVWDGVLPAHNSEDVTISTTPTVALAASKTVTPQALHLYGAAAPNAVTYQITLSNPDPVNAASGILITDTLPPGFSFGVGDTASVTINAGLPALPLPPASLVWTPPLVLGGSGTLAIALGTNVIPAGGTAVVTFTASVAAATAANTYYNSFTLASDPAIPTANIQAASFGPTAALVIDPVHVNKLSTVKGAVAGGKAYYRFTVSNTAPFSPYTTLDAGSSITDTLPAGFTFGDTIAVDVNGTPVPLGVYVPPVAGSTAPTWILNTTVPGAQAGVNTVITVDFYANVASTVVPGVYQNSISALNYSIGGVAVTALNPYNGTLAQNTADDVIVSALGISKSVVNPYASVVNTPLGTQTQYEIVVSNASVAAQTVNIQDTLPAGFSLNALGTYYYAFGSTPPVLAPPAAPWVAATAPLPAAGAPLLFNNAGVGFAIPAPVAPAVQNNLYLRFTADIASVVTAATYNNQADVRLTATPNVVVASFSGAPVTVIAPQTFLSKITTTPSVGKDIYGNYTPAHYKLTLTNVGSAAATGVSIVDTLPLGFTYDPYSVKVSINGVAQAAGTYTVPAALLSTFNFTTLPAGGFTVPAATGGVNGLLSIEYDALIAPTTVPQVAGHVNSATSASTNAGAQGPVTATVRLYDVGLSKTTTTPSLIAGQTATYTIFVSNFGAVAIPNVVVSDFLPAGFSYTALSTTGIGWAPTEPLISGNQLDWTIPNLPANSTATITFSALVLNTTTPAVYRNSVVATGNAGALAPVLFPNTGPTAPITITQPTPLLTVLKLANNPTAKPGDTISYTIFITNTGAGQANVVDITDAMSPYTKLALAPFAPANTTFFSFVDGANPSGLLGTATATFSNDGGVTYNYTPVDDGTGHDPAVTNFRLLMDGVMNADQLNNPSFSLQYQVQVK